MKLYSIFSRYFIFWYPFKTMPHEFHYSLRILFSYLLVAGVYKSDWFFFFFNVYFWERKRQTSSWGRAEREGDTESKAVSRLWVVSTNPEAGPEAMNHEIMTGAEVGHLANWATQVPQIWLFLNTDFKSRKVLKFNNVKTLYIDYLRFSR